MRVTDKQALSRVKDSITFLQLEYSKVSKSRHSLTVEKRGESGTFTVQAANLSCIFLGPGCSITSSAITLLADHGVSVVCTGQEGLRHYAG